MLRRPLRVGCPRVRVGGVVRRGPLGHFAAAHLLHLAALEFGGLRAAPAEENDRFGTGSAFQGESTGSCGKITRAVSDGQLLMP
jgi:hypothetical protein